jgi:hypothetical protein
MTKHQIESNESYTTDVTIRKSDNHTSWAYVSFNRHYAPEEIRACNEMFMTVGQLEELGKFMLREAAKMSASAGK